MKVAFLKRINKFLRWKKGLSIILGLLFIIISFSAVSLVYGTSWTAVFSTLTAGFFDQTEPTSLGLRLDAPVLSMDFNEAYESSNGYYQKDKSIYNNFGQVHTNSVSSSDINGQYQCWEVGSSASLANGWTEMSLETWIKFDSFTDDNEGVIFMRGTKVFGLNMGSTGNDNVRFFIQDSAGTYCYAGYSSQDLQLNTWYHLVGTFKRSGNCELYIDGQLKNSAGAGAGYVSQDDKIKLGWDDYGGFGNRMIDGQMDEVRIYNKQLSSSEVALRYNSGRGYYGTGSESGLVVGYHMHDTTDYKNSYNGVKCLSNASYIPIASSAGIVENPANFPTYNSTGGPDGSGAYSFDGTDDYIDLGSASNLDLGNSFTLGAWVKPASDFATTRKGVIIKDSAHTSPYSWISAIHGTLMSLYNGSAWVDSDATTFSSGSWYYLNWVVENGNVTFYRNGINIGTQPFTYTDDSNDSIYIGSWTGGTNTFNGSMDNVQIWDRALSQAEVLELYNGSVGGYSGSDYIGKYSRLGDFTSNVFYNATSTFWGTLLDFAGSTGEATSTYAICQADANCISYWDLDSPAISLALNYGAQGTYDTTHAFMPSVVKVDSTYHMWYAGYNGTNYRILHTTSADGITWATPTLVLNIGAQGTYDTTHAYQPSVVYDNGTYHMWYGGNNGTNVRILHTTSANGTTWATPTLVLNIGAQGTYDTTHASAPSVVKVGSTYHMWYAGYNGTYRILHTTSANGTTWATPTLVLNIGAQGTYDVSHANTPSVVYDNGTYHMWYAGHNGNYRILHTTSADGTTWTTPRMAVDINSQGLYHTSHAYYPSVIKDTDGFKMWYGAHDGAHVRIAYVSLDDYQAYNSTDKKGSNDGTPTGTNNATGISSGAMRFDGVDDYVKMSAPSFSGNQQGAISFWFSAPSQSDKNIFSYINPATGAVDEMRVGWYGTTVYFTHRANSVTDYQVSIGSGMYSFNTWQHFVVMSNGSDTTFYLNGNLLTESVQAGSDTGAWFGDLVTDANTFILGTLQRSGVGTGYFNGSIDEVLIYNDALTPAEITAIYKAGLSQHATSTVALQTRTADSYNVSDEGLVSQWDFNDGTANDAMGVNNGTVTEAVFNEDNGVVGLGGYFDGNNDFISTANSASLALTQNYSVSAWTKLSSTQTTKGMVVRMTDGDVGFQLAIRSDGKFGFPRYQNDAASNVVPSVGRWYHVVGVQEGTNTNKLYVDGVLQSTQGTRTTNNANLGVAIGRLYSAWSGYYFNGSIDEARIYNRALSAAEVLDLYQMGTSTISWGEWADEGEMTDGVVASSTGSGKFFQYKAVLETDDTNVSPYILDYAVSTTTGPVATTSPTLALTSTGTQTATTTMPATDFASGGAFLLTATDDDITVNSIKFKQLGSLPVSEITNVTFSTADSVEGACASSTPESPDAFGTADSFDENNIATTTADTPLVVSTTTPICLYINYSLPNAYSTSTLGRSIDFEITNPSTDIIVEEGGTVTTTSKVNIADRTIVMTNDVLAMLSIQMRDPAKNPTLYYLQNSMVWKKEGDSEPYRLINPNLQVHDLSFEDRTGNGTHTFIHMSVTISNMDPGDENVFLNVTQTLSTGAVVRAGSGR